MPKFTPFVVGSLLLLAGTIGSCLLAGHNPANWLFLPPLLAMVLMPLGCCTLAFGVRGPVVLVRAFAVFWSEPPAPEAALRIVSAYISYLYGAGAFVFLASLLSIMACLSEVVAQGLTQPFGENVTATIVSLMYPVVAAEFILRPLKHRLAEQAGA